MSPCLLIEILRAPQSASTLDPTQWALLIRQARAAELLGSLRSLFSDRGLLESVPEAPRVHLESGYLTAQKQVRDVRYEVRCICRTLARSGAPLILLKGAAYVMANLPVGRSRLFGDVDVLVPRDMLEAVEQALRADMWMPDDHDEYDQHYYRTWMHQIPPLVHLDRESVIDVHHSIVPDTARFDVQVQALHDAARPVPGFSNLWVLSPAHMVVHSAAHLFNEGEFEHGLRDLVDLDGLMRDFDREETFWHDLIDAAEVLDLTRPLYYALRYTRRLLDTPVPDKTLHTSRRSAPVWPLRVLMDALFLRVLVPPHATCMRPGARLARFVLFVRSHYLRMPFPLLLPHLLRKAWSRVVTRE